MEKDKIIIDIKSEIERINELIALTRKEQIEDVQKGNSGSIQYEFITELEGKIKGLGLALSIYRFHNKNKKEV